MLVLLVHPESWPLRSIAIALEWPIHAILINRDDIP